MEPALVVDLIAEGWPSEAFDADRNLDLDVLRAHGWTIRESGEHVIIELPEHVQQHLEERHEQARITADAAPGEPFGYRNVRQT
jgi:hypothetical protein